MNAHACSAGALSGLRPSDIQAAAHDVTLRPGVVDAFARAAGAGVPMHVLSVNWCADFVEQVGTWVTGSV